MKWVMTILAIVVGVSLIANGRLANVKRVDTSPEALREMATLREALQVCEVTKRQADFDAPKPVPTPALEDANRPNLMRGLEGTKQKCLLEAAQLGKAAAVWCAGL